MKKLSEKEKELKAGGEWIQAENFKEELTWLSQGRDPTPSAMKSMYISGCGILAMGGRGCWDPDCPSGGSEEAPLVMRGTRWGALSSAGKTMASYGTILSIMVR